VPSQVKGRRRFLTRALGTAAAGLAARPLAALTQQAPVAPPPAAPVTPPSLPLGKIGPEHYVTLGRTGVRVSPVAAGLSLKADPLMLSADAGINYFDTAEKYLNGQHNRLVGEALKGRDRKSIFVSAKFQDGLQKDLTATTDEIVTRMHRCLERLGTDYVDCMLIHNLQNPDAVDNPQWLAAYDRLKADGKVRFLGASTHDPRLPDMLARVVQSGRYDLMLVAYNPTTEGDLYGSKGWPVMTKILEEAGRKKIAVATMKIMVGAVAAGTVTGVGHDGVDPNDITGRGKYLEARVAATRWVLSNPNVNVVQYTMTGPETVAAAVEAATTRFTKKDEAVARAYHESVRGHGCPIPCPSPCLSACPAGVAVPDVLRHRMYDRHFGLTDQARLEYGELSAGRQAAACATCISQACVAACPEGLPVASLTRDAHRQLGHA